MIFNSGEMLSESNKKIKKDRREEIRGLFTIGILAILMSYRLQDKELEFTYLEKSFNLTFLIDITIVLWVLYGICMIFSFSDDIFGEGFIIIFKNLGKYFMTLSLAFFIIISIIFSLNIYPNRTQIFIDLLFLFLIGLLGLFILQLMLKLEVSRIKNKLEKFTIVNIAQISLVLFIINLIAILYIPDTYEQIVPFLFPIELILIVIYFGITFQLIMANKSNSKKN